MSDFEKPGATLDKPAKQRSAATGFGDLGDRLARAVGAFERTKGGVAPSTSSADPDDAAEHHPIPAREPLTYRFRLAWRGYHCAAVDEYVAELERELATLREQSASAGSVKEEIDRIGDQTATILRAAHEQAATVTHRAQTDAERCVAEAQSDARAITAAAERRLHELDSETDCVWRERARLVADVHALADALSSLAQDAADRFPPELEGGEHTVELRVDEVEHAVDVREHAIDAGEHAVDVADSTTIEPDVSTRVG